VGDTDKCIFIVSCVVPLALTWSLACLGPTSFALLAECSIARASAPEP